MGERKRIYITVKTYPTISEKYAELVCTAGILEDGTWMRLYPIPFRQLRDDQKYPKYAWINVDVEKNPTDFRVESYRPDLSSLTTETKPKKADWNERRRVILQNGTVYTNLSEIISKAKNDEISLVTFKPSKILDFIIEPHNPEWDPKKLEYLQMQSRQFDLFKSTEEIEEEFRVAKKIPYKFSYRFEDDSGKKSKLMIEDWEIGMLYLRCLNRADGNEEVAINQVKQKFMEEFAKRDIYFFLGTTLEHHYTSKNPFIIIGVFYPPKLPPNEQMSLF